MHELKQTMLSNTFFENNDGSEDEYEEPQMIYIITNNFDDQ